MKTLFLIFALTLTTAAQSLITADGVEWRYVATGRDKDGAKFNVFARRVKSDKYPALEVKFGDAEPIQAEHDCGRRMYRTIGGEWAKPQGSVGDWLIKFACKK